LLTLQMKYLISNWIDDYNDGCLYRRNNLPYKFRLIFSGSQNGFSRSIFENKCYNIERTVVVMRIKETGELVGGYNPVCWNIKDKSLDEKYWIETDKCFIFKIDEDQMNKSILSRVKNPGHAILHNEQKVNEAEDDVNFHERLIDF